MKEYVAERAVLYYFLMQGLNDGNENLWRFIMKSFGLSAKKDEYGGKLKNPILCELQTIEDIILYKNYIDSFGKESEFGRERDESAIIDLKLSAFLRLNEIFKGVQDKGDRLKTLSHVYEHSHTAAVMYALQILYSNKDGRGLAVEVLEKELNAGKNSDAGILLLQLNESNINETLSRLFSLPDMALRPDLTESLTARYGYKIDGLPRAKKNIGFGN